MFKSAVEILSGLLCSRTFAMRVILDLMIGTSPKVGLGFTHLPLRFSSLEFGMPSIVQLAHFLRYKQTFLCVLFTSCVIAKEVFIWLFKERLAM